MKLGEAAQAEAANASDTHSANNQTAGDNVVDAEFTEIDDDEKKAN
ncbi:hypothetical protein HED51_12440 [Ochrobactrum grignonense]|nr:hypothetical protein [Brucella grignonensis]